MVKLYEDYRNFIKLVLGMTKNQFRNKKGMIEEIESIEDEIDINYIPNVNSDNSDDDGPDQTFLTKVMNASAPPENPEENNIATDKNRELEMSAEEKKDKLLGNFTKMQDFLDILRKVEEENYYII